VLVELGDIIKNVNGREINAESDLFQALEECKPGDIVTVIVQRVMAVSDELVDREATLRIKLSESTKFEKNILSNSNNSQESPFLPDEENEK
jgi:S1-C subfamily serine protease